MMTEAKGYSPPGLAAIERVRSGVVLVIRDLTRHGGTPAERSLVLLDAEHGRALSDASLWAGVQATLANRPGREATRLLPATHRSDPTPSYP